MPAETTSFEEARVRLSASADRFAYPVNDGCRAMGIGRTLCYELIRRGELQVVKIGGRTLIPRSEIERLTRVDSDVAA